MHDPEPDIGASSTAGRRISGDEKAIGKSNDTAIVLVTCFGLLVCVGFIDAQTVTFDFVGYDDPEYVYENPHVVGGINKGNLIWAFTSTNYARNWHPLTWISHMLDLRLYGLRPGGHHLTSILIHAAAAMLLFFALRRLTGDPPCSGLTAVIFAVHPLRVESVAWISERKDVLSGFCFALVLYAYAGYARRPSIRRMALVVTALILGLMCKPMLVTAPFVLLLLDYWPLGRLSAARGRVRALLPRLLAEKAPLFALAAAAAVLTMVSQDQAIQPINRLSLPARLGNAAVSYVVYIRQTFWPSCLAAIYPHPGESLPSWHALASGTVLLAITVAALVVRRRRPYLLVGWLWYLGMLVPVIGLVQVGEQAHADRYTYLPQIGIIVGLTWWAADLAVSWRLPRPLLTTAAMALTAALCLCSQRQTRHWHDGITLFHHAVLCDVDNPLAHQYLGTAFERASRFEEAAVQYAAAVRINPRDAVAWNGLGHVEGARGHTDEALHCFQKALAILPNDPLALRNCGVAMFQLGRYAEAADYFQRWAALDPSNALPVEFLEKVRARQRHVSD